MNIYVIYDSPKGYPGKYVMRVFEVTTGESKMTDRIAVSSSLEAVRDSVPPECTRVVRDPNDDPAILESWV